MTQGFGSENEIGFGDSTPYVTRSGAPRTIGILNIVFGLLLLLCSGCLGIYAVIFTQVGKAMAAQQPMANGVAPPDVANMFGLTDANVRLYVGVELISAVALNLLLIVTGVGLLMYKEWARTLAVLLSASKILRLIALSVWFASSIAALIGSHYADEMFKIQAQIPNQGRAAQLQPADFGRTISLGFTIWHVVVSVLGAIYPLICLLVLSRSAVRQSTQATRPRAWEP